MKMDKATEQQTKWSIRNHLGGEVGYIETKPTDPSDPIVYYAIQVRVNSSELRRLGYKAVRITDQK